MNQSIRDQYDVVVVGDGPTGTSCAQLLTRCGHDVLLLERDRHPRFCVGESLLPATNPIWETLDVVDAFAEAGFIKKTGAYFSDREGRFAGDIMFPEAQRKVADSAWQVQREKLDKILWDKAVASGAQCVDKTHVRRFVMEGKRCTGVDLTTEGGERKTVNARLVMDASGRRSQLARQLDLRQPDPHLTGVAIYTHYRGVSRSSGDDEGTIGILATHDGWGWIIPFSDDTASVGLVIKKAAFQQAKPGRSVEELWQHLLDQTPSVANRLNRAERVRDLSVVADFSYRARRVAGDGWVLVGDAAAFLDPVFSSGIHLAVTGAWLASRDADRALCKPGAPRGWDFLRYRAKVWESLYVYSHFIYAWDDPDYRDMFILPTPNSGWVKRLKREIISVLAGNGLPAWRVMPWYWTFLIVSRLRARFEKRGALPPAF